MPTEKELLATQRAAKAAEEVVAKPSQLAPTTLPIIVDWCDLDTGEPHTLNLVVRTLDFDEENKVELMAAHLAKGQMGRLDPEYVRYLKGLSTIFVLWEPELPASLQTRLHVDRDLVEQLYGVVEVHRARRFQGGRGEGQGPTATVRLANAEGLAR